MRRVARDEVGGLGFPASDTPTFNEITTVTNVTDGTTTTFASRLPLPAARAEDRPAADITNIPMTRAFSIAEGRLVFGIGPSASRPAAPASG